MGISLTGKVSWIAIFTPHIPSRIREKAGALTAELDSQAYPDLKVQAGIPVELTLHANPDQITACNDTIIISAYGVEKELKAGDNIITFTPAESGTVAYSCWMGMIDASIYVVDDLTEE